MWSNGNGLESPSISLESSRASEEAPRQGAAEQKEAKMLGWKQLRLSPLGLGGGGALASLLTEALKAFAFSFLCLWLS